MSFNKEYCKMQFELHLARAAHWNAIAVSGAYKFRKTQRGTDEKNEDGSIKFRDLTDEEKLQDTISIMNAHLHNARECLDAYGDHMNDGSIKLA